MKVLFHYTVRENAILLWPKYYYNFCKRYLRITHQTEDPQGVLL